MADHYDVIVIGSGAGGGTLTYSLASTGKRILLLERGGWYQPEARPFLAHVTVARVAKGGRVSREPLAAPGQLRFSASTVTLFRSRLSAAGARYEALARFELSG